MTTYYIVQPQEPTIVRTAVSSATHDFASTDVTATESIDGVAYNKLTGATIAGLTVYLVRKVDGFQCASTVTDGSGAWSFVRDANDPYEYRVEAETIAAGTRIHGTTDWNLVGT